MSDTSRWAIENGPDEPETYTCTSCDGTGRGYNSRLASRPGDCRECEGTGSVVIDPDDWLDTRDHDRDETLLYDDIDLGERHFG